VVDLGLTSERFVSGLEYMPTERRVVRAIFFTLEETGQWLGSWTPWYGFVRLPAGVAYRLPAGSHVVAEIHYRGAKEPVVERGTLGLSVADRPASPGLGDPRPSLKSAVGGSANQPSDLILEAKGEVLPNVAAQAFRAQTRLMSDTQVLSLRPDLFPGAKSIEVSARKPDGGTEILLFAKDLPIGWPTPYILQEPVRLLRGTVLSATASYANATAGPQPGGFRLTVSRFDRQMSPASSPARTTPRRRSH
jgi:hypothetical protein